MDVLDTHLIFFCDSHYPNVLGLALTHDMAACLSKDSHTIAVAKQPATVQMLNTAL